jgi:hypothetical protein
VTALVYVTTDAPYDRDVETLHAAGCTHLRRVDSRVQHVVEATTVADAVAELERDGLSTSVRVLPCARRAGTARLSLAASAMRTLFPAPTFDLTDIARDPLVGAYRHVTATDGSALRAAAADARAAGYVVTLLPGRAVPTAVVSAQ